MTAESTANAPQPPGASLTRRSDRWTDLGLTLPIFLLYHLGVVFLPVQNAADPVTRELRALANQSFAAYAGLTLAIGAAFVVVLLAFGQRKTLEAKRFVWIGAEGAVYAVAMRFAGAYAVGSLRLAPAGVQGPFAGLVMALGAGFYEEIAFRVALFGGGALFLKKLFAGRQVSRWMLTCIWALVAACVFSGWHYFGELGDPWDTPSFVFRAACGVVLTAIFVFRGFAPAVWTHALYDVWVLVLG